MEAVNDGAIGMGVYSTENEVDDADDGTNEAECGVADADETADEDVDVEVDGRPRRLLAGG